MYLSSNDSLPWSIELIERFEKHWDWGRVCLNPEMQLLLPQLRRVHIVEVMEHHFGARFDQLGSNRRFLVSIP